MVMQEILTQTSFSLADFEMHATEPNAPLIVEYPEG